MRTILYILLAIILLAAQGFAAPVYVSMSATHEGNPSWLEAEGGSYIIGESYGGGPTQPMRIAVFVYANNEVVGGAWDDPTDRTIPIIVEFNDAAPRAKRFTARARTYPGGPWMAEQLYAEGDKIIVGGEPTGGSYLLQAGPSDGSSSFHGIQWFPGGTVVDNGDGTISIPKAAHGFVGGDQIIIRDAGSYNGTYTLGAQVDPDILTITATYDPDNTPIHPARALMVAGTSGTVQPVWAEARRIDSDGSILTISASAAIDNGDGTVGIPVVGHGYLSGDHVTISGTTNYDGIYTLYDQTAGGEDLMIIMATYVAETFAGTETIQGYAKAIDNGDGTVSLPCAEHGFVAGQEIAILGGGPYSGVHVLPVQADPDALTLTSTYTAWANVGNTLVTLNTMEDPDSAGVTWRFLFQWPNRTSASYSSNRVIMRGQAGEGNVIQQSGTKFNLGTSAHAP